MKINIALLILALLLISSCRKDSSSSGNPSITLISPARNSFASLTPTFKWNVNNLNGPYTLYLHYFSQSLSQYTTDSISTINTSYTWTTSLTYDNSYSWYIRSGTVLSAIDSFTTIYPDSMFVGTYWVTVGAESSSPYSTWIRPMDNASSMYQDLVAY